MELGDNFPELPVPVNSRRVCLGLMEMETKEVLKRVVFFHMADNMPLNEIADRIVLGMKLLNGLTVEQLREALSGGNCRIYYDIE